MDEPERIKASDAIERSRKVLAKHRLLQQKKRHFREVMIAVPALAILLYITNFLGPGDQLQKQHVSCDEYDKTCHAEKLLDKVEVECSNRIANSLSYEFEWTDSLTAPRYQLNDWYVPGKSIMFTGSELMVANIFGAKVRTRYFCVASISTGLVIKAGISSSQ